MSKGNAARSFLEQLADFEDPAPKDVDPENEAEKHNTDTDLSEDEVISQVEAREHYVDVEQSKLRKHDDIDLGIRYSGASISRNGLEDESEDDKDNPFGNPGMGNGSENGEEDSEEEEEEAEAIEDFGSDGDDDDDQGDEEVDRSIPEAFRGTSSSSEDDESEDGEDIDDDMESDISSPPPRQTDRAALRKMMAEEQKSVAAALSAAAKADIAKGKAIKQQHSTFDSLLNTRIKLQKALIATNSLAAVSKSSTSESNNAVVECALASRAAEEAALNLWNSIKSLRNSLHPSKSKKRPSPASTETSNQHLWDQTTYLDTEATAQRRVTLTKWSERTKPVTALRPQNRFSQLPAQQSLVSVLDQQLTGESMERAVKRTRVARSCAPVQARSKAAIENEHIYDDADFYTLLLRELVDRRMADTQVNFGAPTSDLTAALPSRAELKVKKQVDTKASKGRKMRYTVQEKLQNFMAADDRGSWGERQRAELFGSLLGRKVQMDEGPADDEGTEEENDLEAGGLKLFGR